MLGFLSCVVGIFDAKLINKLLNKETLIVYELLKSWNIEKNDASKHTTSISNAIQSERSF